MTQLSLLDFTVPTMPVIETNRMHVKVVNHETARIICEKYHYAHRVPMIIVAVGAYVDDTLAGLVTYGLPPNRNALGFCGEEYIKNGLELNRLFVHDWAGKNTESWLIAQSFKVLQQRHPEYFLLVSYADPSQGHVGYVYQATNWIYTGQGAKGSSDAIINGVRMSEKNIVNKFTTRSRTKLRGMGLTVEEIKSEEKHRYIYILGDKRQRKRYKRLLKWPIFPYPKLSKD